MNVTISVDIALPIDSPEQLETTLTKLGSFYFSPGNKKFFGSEVLKVWPTANGCAWLERISPGETTYQSSCLVLGPRGYEIHPLARDYDSIGPKAKRLATKAAEEYANAHPY